MKAKSPVDERIVLTKAFFGMASSVISTPKWISNGHVALHVSRIKNAVLYRQEEIVKALCGEVYFRSLADSAIERQFPALSATRYQATPFRLALKGDKRLAHLFFSDDMGVMGFDGYYVRLLGLKEVYASNAKGPAIDSLDAPTVLIGPVNTQGLLDQLTLDVLKGIG